MKSARPTTHLPLNYIQQAVQARRIAEVAHAGQRDKSNEPYFEHPAQVASLALQAARDDPALSEQDHYHVAAAAYLHDVIEDTPFEAEDLLALGISDEVVSTVQVLTHGDGESNRSYLNRVLRDPLATIVKAADVEHNSDHDRLDSLDRDTRDRLARKYLAARRSLGMHVPGYLLDWAGEG